MGLLRQPVVQVPTRSQAGSDEQAGFSGGVNPAAAVGIVDPTQYAAITNMRLVRDQEIAKRPGLRLIGTAIATSIPYVSTVGFTPIQVLFVPLGNAAAPQYGLVDVGNGPTPNLSGLTSLPAVGAYSRGPSSAQFRDATADVLYIAAYDPLTPKGMLKWNGTTITENVGSITTLSQLWVYNQRLFGCKGNASPLSGSSQTLYWSALNNGDTIGVAASGGGFASIRTFGGQNIIGGFAVGDTNYILHESAVSTFRGLTYDDISISAGTVGTSPNIGRPLAWTVIDEIGYVLTMKGLFLASNGGFVPVDSAEAPDPILQFFRATQTTDDPSANTCIVVDNARRREVWCIVNSRARSGGVLTAHVFIWSKRFRRFTGQATFGVPISWAGVVTDPYGVSLMLLFNGTTGKLYGVDFLDDAYQVYQDDSVSYPSSVQMRRFYTEQPSYQKAYRFLNINMGGGSGETLVATGTSTGASVTYATTTGGTVADTTNMKAQEVNIIQLSGQGSYLDATITDGTGSSTGWSVLRADVDAYILAQRAG